MILDRAHFTPVDGIAQPFFVDEFPRLDPDVELILHFEQGISPEATPPTSQNAKREIAESV